jgi:hypothetical protein
VVINSSTFSAGGDSGSLIVTNDANHNPVALLFAGSSTTTIGNPIGQVLTQVSNALGRTVSFVGSGQALSIETLASNSLLRQEMELANAVKNRHERFLMEQPGVMGVGVGIPEGDSVEGAIVVYIDQTKGRAPVLPQSLDNVRVRGVLSDPFVAK